MSKKCPNCGRGIGVYQDYVGGTSFFRCDICGHTGCDFEDATLFDRITRSVEVLAPKFVYFDYSVCDDNGMGYPWCSTLFEDGGHFETEEKAIAATIEKLKEVWKCESI